MYEQEERESGAHGKSIKRRGEGSVEMGQRVLPMIILIEFFVVFCSRSCKFSYRILNQDITASPTSFKSIIHKSSYHSKKHNLM
jgi:hypothetical protein